jgi:hypothetical protein
MMLVSPGTLDRKMHVSKRNSLDFLCTTLDCDIMRICIKAENEGLHLLLA